MKETKKKGKKMKNKAIRRTRTTRIIIKGGTFIRENWNITGTLKITREKNERKYTYLSF